MINIRERIEIETSTLFVTSDSLFELERERLGEEAFYEMLEKADSDSINEIETAQNKMDAEVNKLTQMVRAYGQEYLMEGV